MTYESDSGDRRAAAQRKRPIKGNGTMPAPVVFKHVRTGIKRQPNRLPDRSGRV